MAIMIPKTLTTTVLAAIPLQEIVPGGEFIEPTTCEIIIFEYYNQFISGLPAGVMKTL
jgi:hypothetical protein